MAIAQSTGTAFVPASNSHLPSVTMSMLLDFLDESCAIIRQPPLARRTFLWFAAVTHDEVACAAPPNIADAHILFVCHESEASNLLKAKPAAFAVVIAEKSTEEGATPPRCDITSFADRFVLVQPQRRFSFFVFQMQSYFTQLLIWENELDRIAAHNGTLADMLDASTAVIKNFLFVSDSNFNVIAYSTNIQPPDSLHRRIVEDGCLTPQMIEEKRQRLPEKTYYIKEPSGVTPFARLSHPLYLNHTYFGSLSMSCHAQPLTDGLKDLFAILVKRVLSLCETLWRAQMKLNVPHYFFFQRMIEHEQVPAEYINSQMEMLGLNDESEYKLVAMQVDSNTDPELAARVTRNAGAVNQGNVFCFPYQDKVLMLLHTPPSDSRLSHIKTMKALREHIYEPLGVISGVSEVFTGIDNLDLAWRQTQIALGLKRTIDSEQFVSDEEEEARGVYLFGDAILYFLIDQGGCDNRFMSFCFDHTILQKLYSEDRRNGTNYLALFWFYLYYGRNATAVAKRLHIHRNTVLYHIEKIQKRFDFDLSWRIARDRMMLDFKMFFLTESHASIEKIFAEPIVEA